MKLRHKKGFTIIELVIVIAVIGILTAVLVPTFINLTNKANEAADDSLVKNLNTALKMEEQLLGNKKNETLQDAVDDLEAEGYLLENLISKSGQDLLWNQTNNEFVINKENKFSGKDYWKIVDKLPTKANQKYSYYAGANFDETTTSNELAYGFDAGKNTDIVSLTYTGTDTAQEVAIRTNSFGTTLNINAPQDTVNHYGNVAIVNVQAIDSASYHENGTVGRLIVTKGHAVAEEKAVVFCFIDAGSGDAATVEVKTGATVFDENGVNNGQNAVVEDSHDDCGPGNHNFGSQLVIDSHVYEVCKSCGYTLVHIVDEITGEDTLTTKVDSSNNIVNTPVETFNNNSESVNEDGTVKSDATPSISAVDASELSTTCSHEFGDPVVIEPTCYAEGSKTYTCTKCGSTMTTSMAKTAHRFYDDGSEYEKCLYHAICHTDRGDVKVAKIGNTEYSTLRQAIAAITDNTPTTITMIADEAIYGNDGYTIAAGRDITIDLNGHKICNYITENKGSNVFTINNGSLTIKDSTDVNKDGTGYGIIYNDYDRANENIHVGEWWGTPQYNYATNVIKNSGTLTIESGRIYQTAAGSICYAVDNNSTSYDTTLNVNGGLISDAYGTVVRMFCNSTTKENIINVNGGSIVTPGYAAIWTQLPGSNASSHKKATLNISGGTISAGSYAWYDYTYGDGWNNVNYSIIGGTFKGDIYSYNKTNFVTGGTFDRNLSNSWIAEKYTTQANGDGTYTVVAAE